MTSTEKRIIMDQFHEASKAAGDDERMQEILDDMLSGTLKKLEHVTKDPAAGTILHRLEELLGESGWGDSNVPEQARALFTAFCFVSNTDPDTSVYDGILQNLYDALGTDGTKPAYEEFDMYMCALLV